jgi:hypothetical protein
MAIVSAVAGLVVQSETATAGTAVTWVRKVALLTLGWSASSRLPQKHRRLADPRTAVSHDEPRPDVS